MVTADLCLIGGLDGYDMDQGCQFVRFRMGRTDKVMKRRLPGVKFVDLQARDSYSVFVRLSWSFHAVTDEDPLV